MERRDIQLGKQYAIRDPVAPGVPFHRVQVLEAVRGSKWRVKWIDPNRGLVDYVASRNIIALWGQRHRVTRDEASEERLQRAIQAGAFPGEDHPVNDAVQVTLEATGEPSLTVFKGTLHCQPDALGRVADRARTRVPRHAAGYRDRHGDHRLPWDCALELAEAFARHEPRTVLDYVDAQERSSSSAAREPGGRYHVETLTSYRAAWALIRQWAGSDAAMAARDLRINILEQLLTRAMWDLRRPDADPRRVAARIERGLRGQ